MDLEKNAIVKICCKNLNIIWKNWNKNTKICKNDTQSVKLTVLSAQKINYTIINSREVAADATSQIPKYKEGKIDEGKKEKHISKTASAPDVRDHRDGLFIHFQFYTDVRADHGI